MTELAGQIADLKEFAVNLSSTSIKSDGRSFVTSLPYLKTKNYPDEQWIGVVCLAVRKANLQVLEAACEIIRDIVKWKQAPNGAMDIVTQLMQKPQNFVELEALAWEQKRKILEKYAEVGFHLKNGTEKVSAGKNAGAKIVEFLFILFSEHNTYYAACLKHLHEMVKWEEADLCKKQDYIQMLHYFFVSHPMEWYSAKEQEFVRPILPGLASFLKNLKLNAENRSLLVWVHKHFKWLEGQELTNHSGYLSMFGTAYMEIADQLFLHKEAHGFEGMSELTIFIPECISWMSQEKRDVEDELRPIADLCFTFIFRIMNTCPELIMGQLELLVKLFLSSKGGDQPAFAAGLNKCYKIQKGRPIIDNYTEDFVALLVTLQHGQDAIICDLLRQVSENNILALEEEIGNLEPHLLRLSLAPMIVQIFLNMSNKKPVLFKSRGDHYFDSIRETEAESTSLIKFYFNLTKIDETESERVVGIMEAECKQTQDKPHFVKQVLHYWAIVAKSHPHILEQKRDYLVELRKNLELEENAQAVIDILDKHKFEESERIRIEEEKRIAIEEEEKRKKKAASPENVRSIMSRSRSLQLDGREEDGCSSEKIELTPPHVALCCSPDKLYEMHSLQKKLQSLGYRCETIAYTQGNVADIKCQVVIPAISMRFSKSSIAANQISKCDQNGKAILPLLIDEIDYPPPSLDFKVLNRFEPVDCGRMRSRAQWIAGSDEFEEILDRLQILVPQVRPIRIPRPERSNIPRARDHHASSEKPLPLDPLAREASEIKIQVRPPTPKQKDTTHLPVKKRQQTASVERAPIQLAYAPSAAVNSYDDDDDDWSDSDEDDEILMASGDQENAEAKDCQNGFNLPKLKNLDNSNEPHQPKIHQNGNSVKSIDKKVRPTFGIAPRPKETKTEPSKGKGNLRQRGAFVTDAPKLPSLYRKRFTKP